METRKTSKSIRIIYWVTRIGYYLVIAGGIIILGLSIPLLGGWELSNTNFNIDLPATLETTETGRLKMGSETTTVDLVELQGKISIKNFYDAPSSYRVYYTLIIVIFYGGFIMMAHYFMLFIRKIYRHEIFSDKNEQYLKLISYLVIGMWVILKILGVILYFYFYSSLTFEGIELGAPYVGGINHLLFGLFVYVLAHVFAEGRKIEEENRLTV